MNATTLALLIAILAFGVFALVLGFTLVQFILRVAP